MRNQPAVTVRRADYQPPAYRIERIDLEFDLDPAATRVTTTLRRAPQCRAGGYAADPRRRAAAAQLDRARRPASRTQRLRPARQPARRAHRPGAARRGAAQGATREHHPSGEEHRADGPVPVARQFLHAVRGRGLPPHHLLPRPARRHGDVRRDAARRPQPLSGAARQRQPRGRGRARRRPPLRALGRPASRSRATCSRSWPAASSASRTELRTRSGREVSAAGLGRARQSRQDRARDGVAQARDPLGRAALRPRARPRPLHDRRVQRLQHGRDGEQGPEHLQREVRSGQPAGRHRHRLRQHRVDRRPRVLPQLDRQPRHLPRLVPAVRSRKA